MHISGLGRYLALGRCTFPICGAAIAFTERRISLLRVRTDTVNLMTLQYVKESSEVFYTQEAIPLVGPSEIAFLKKRAASNIRKRSRLCLHRSPQDIVHEMIIVHHRDAFVRPHRHLGKSESLGVLEGAATLLTYDDGGCILNRTSLGVGSTYGTFHYRMPAEIWHSLLITSQWFVFIETTQGPFDRILTEFPEWAPDGNNDEEVAEYTHRVAIQARVESQ